MLTISDGYVFIESGFASSEKAYNFFKFCVKNENVLFPVRNILLSMLTFQNKLELDPIDAVSYVIDTPCEAIILNSETVSHNLLITL